MDITKVLELHKEGVSNREIARRLGRETQESTVRGIIARNGVAKPYVRRTARKGKDDSWTDNQGQLPVPVGTRVQVIHRSGKQFVAEAGVPGRAQDWSISPRKVDGDILKWKLA